VTSVRLGSHAWVKLDSQADTATLAALRQAGRLLPAFTDGKGRVSAATGRIVVVAPVGKDLDRALTIGSRHGLSQVKKLHYGQGLHLLDGQDGWRALDALAELRAAGLKAELDMLRRHELRYIPDDPLFPEQWHLLNLGQGMSTASVDGRVSEAWDLTTGDPQVIVAVNDSGVDLNHADFTGKLEPELNYPTDWESLMAPGSYGDHGTSVAGVAAALADDSLGGAGVCPDCRILPHLIGEVIGPAFNVTDVEVADGFVAMVDAGAWVINNSWGPSTGEPTYWDGDVQLPNLPTVIADAFDYAENSGRGGLGTVLVWAAGNDNDELGYYGEYPTSVTVGAVGDLGLKVYYSSFGPNQAIAAPSSGMLTGITTTDQFGGYTDSFSGTSSAAPFVSGVIGLMLSANPNLTAAEVRARLVASATPIDQVFGAYQNGHSEYYGGGLVNAYTAVQFATGNCTDVAQCPAPSDDCGSQCGTKALCDLCRTHADCATGHVCQALPSLGRLVCVPEKGSSACPAGTNEHNDYCVPTPDTCGLCVGGEECNGRDDNCNGEVDENDVCGGGAWCFVDGPACGDGLACAGTRCIQSCEDDEDCDDGYTCLMLKDQYGNHGINVRGCVISGGGGDCATGCAVLASSVDDETLAAFVECMDDGNAGCNEAMGCMSLLPIDF
ncbi:MAG: S8 family serine peptidase, partial [Deltaproteobacteria bacterium]|nr:S8 family serine peptidase [Deltaproteobacteria bacterium]